MFSWLMKKLTKNYTEVPLFAVLFNLKSYKENGVSGSCVLKVHYTLKDDKNVTLMLHDLIDYIRENYDMKELSK